MSEGDLLADRKRLKQGLNKWRVLAILGLFGVVAVLVQQYGGPLGGGTKGAMPGSNYIAQINIEDFIGDDPKRDDLFKEVLEDKDAKALIVWMDSPGGTTVGGEELYLQLQEMAKKKPVVAVMRTLCASACYMASAGADHIVARNTTLTGSIGVILESVEVSRLADKLGITPVTLTSGKYKDVPSMTKPLDDEGRAYLQTTLDDAYGEFITIVATGRHMSEERVRELAEGRIYTGRQALPVKLIDQIGGMKEAKDWLVTEKKLDKDLEIEVVEVKPEFESLFDRLSSWAGIEIFNRSSIGLDGLLSIWHPSPVQ